MNAHTLSLQTTRPDICIARYTLAFNIFELKPEEQQCITILTQFTHFEIHCNFSGLHNNVYAITIEKLQFSPI